MSSTNTNTVIRMGNRKLLKQVFERCDCCPNIDFEHSPLFVLLETYAAIPPSKSGKLIHALQDILFVASKADNLSKVIETALECNYCLPPDFDTFKKRYDKAMYLYLNCKDVWDRALLFMTTDALYAHSWYHGIYLPKITPDLSDEARHKLEDNCAAHFWQTQHRGDSCEIKYVQRFNGVHYFYVYLNNYPEIVDTWEASGETGKKTMVRREESFSFNVVFAYNQNLGRLDTSCKGGLKHAKQLEKEFCEKILGYELKETEIVKKVYEIDQLKYRKNQLKPNLRLGVKRARILAMELRYKFMKNKRDKKYVGTDEPDSAIYDAIDREYNCRNVHLNLLKTGWVRVELTILHDNAKHKLLLELRPGQCKFSSENEILRYIGEEYLKETCIDVQPELF